MFNPNIEGLRRKDPVIWEQTFQHLWPVAWSAARRRLGNHPSEDIEDVAIAAISDAARNLDSIATFEELKALTGVIANRRALDHLRRMRAERRGTSLTESLTGKEDPAGPDPNPFEEMDVLELARWVVELTQELTQPQRQLLLVYYVEGLTQAELAKRFDMPMGTVGVTLSRAIEGLRKVLTRHPKLLKELRERLRSL